MARKTDQEGKKISAVGTVWWIPPLDRWTGVEGEFYLRIQGMNRKGRVSGSNDHIWAIRSTTENNRELDMVGHACNPNS